MVVQARGSINFSESGSNRWWFLGKWTSVIFRDRLITVNEDERKRNRKQYSFRGINTINDDSIY